MHYDRRSLLRRAATFGLVAATWACGPGDPPPPGGAGDDTAPPPAPGPAALVAGPGGAAHLLAPMDARPVAYLSRAEMRVYVDRSYLDWAQSKLAAYVSVTTGLWRIRRPEDAPEVPIIPGDTLREFEVVDMLEWDPGMEPSEGDVRLRLGAAVPVQMDLSCTPVLSGDAWVTAGRVEVRRRDGLPGEGGREDFVEVAKGTRHSSRECGEAGDELRILTWTVPTDELEKREPAKGDGR